MSYAGLLRHRFVIERPAQGIEDAWGHVDQAPFEDGETVMGLAQDRRGVEVERAGDLSGQPVVDAVVFLERDAAVTEQDRLRRVDTDQEYEILFLRDAAGAGHHQEARCRLVKPVAVVGSGS